MKKGEKMSEKMRLEMIEKLKGRRLSLKTEFKKGHIPWNKNLTKEKDERIKKLSERMKINNPMKNPEVAKKCALSKDYKNEQPKRVATCKKRGVFKFHSKRMKEGGAVKARRANRKPSKPQIELYNLVVKKFPTAKLEYPIKIFEGKHFLLDIAITEYMINIEYDGMYWHNEKNDNERDMLLKILGWKVIRVNRDTLNILKDLKKNVIQ